MIWMQRTDFNFSEWVLYNECQSCQPFSGNRKTNSETVVLTTKNFIRTVTEIRPEWYVGLPTSVKYHTNLDDDQQAAGFRR